jgi:hypothetical protein
MSMYFLDETDDWPEYQTVRDVIHRLEQERAAILEDIRDAESAMAAGPVNGDSRAKLDGLRMELGDVEKKLDESLSLYR